MYFVYLKISLNLDKTISIKFLITHYIYLIILIALNKFISTVLKIYTAKKTHEHCIIQINSLQ